MVISPYILEGEGDKPFKNRTTATVPTSCNISTSNMTYSLLQLYSNKTMSANTMTTPMIAIMSLYISTPLKYNNILQYMKVNTLFNTYAKILTN